MNIATIRRAPSYRASCYLAAVGLAALGLPVLGAPTAARAAPTITLTTKALAIAGVPGTGNILGAGAAIEVRYTITGAEYGGAPPPVTGLSYFAPAGAKLHPEGFATCAPSTVEKDGLGPCPKQSMAGPTGSVGGFVSFGSERVHETASLQPFFAPGGDIGFYALGTTPVSIEVLSTGHVVDSAPPFGLEVLGEVPLIESVPGALDASITEIDVKVGAAYRRDGKTFSYVTLPKKCPRGGLAVKSEMTFLGGASAQATYKMPCPKE